jgi:prevent-host-death family protein
MAKPRPGEDVRALSELGADAAAVVRQIRRKQRPVVFTQRGRRTAVLIDAAQYQALVDELELLRDVRSAERQLAAGRSLSHAKARSQVLSRLRRP